MHIYISDIDRGTIVYVNRLSASPSYSIDRGIRKSTVGLAVKLFKLFNSGSELKKSAVLLKAYQH